jgi:hypothetical protein
VPGNPSDGSDHRQVLPSLFTEIMCPEIPVTVPITVKSRCGFDGLGCATATTGTIPIISRHRKAGMK